MFEAHYRCFTDELPWPKHPKPVSMAAQVPLPIAHGSAMVHLVKGHKGSLVYCDSQKQH